MISSMTKQIALHFHVFYSFFLSTKSKQCLLRKGLNAPTLVENKQISLKIYHSFILSTTLSFSPMFTTFYYNLKKKDTKISKSQISFKYLTWISVSPIPLHFSNICYPSLLIQSNDI